MKNLIIIISLAFLAISANAQVSIERVGTGNPSVLLEFNDTRDNALDASGTVVGINGVNKTLILPIVDVINANSVEGTLWFDALDDKVKYKSATGIVEMTPAGADVESPSIANSLLSEVADLNGVIIGADNSTAPGVLVLEGTSKVMVLPHVNGVSSVVNPEPGSIVYDKVEKAIAVFNGNIWSYWGNYN